MNGFKMGQGYGLHGLFQGCLMGRRVKGMVVNKKNETKKLEKNNDKKRNRFLNPF